MSIKTRLDRLQGARKDAGEMQIEVAIRDGDGVDCGGKHFSLAEWEENVREFKRNGGQVITVTPETIKRRGG